MSLKVLITGSAGFIGAHLGRALGQTRKFQLFGVDSYNDYYDPALKSARVRHLAPDVFHQAVNIADADALQRVFAEVAPDVVVHLAAQAGVRHSFKDPMSYAESNLAGQVSVLEAIRSTPSVRKLIYASSSSVYSGMDEVPFVEDMRLKTPRSLYAASKISGEVLVDTYSKMLGLQATGLRFFTVYGPWGRPDMAYWSFADAILEGRPIKLFNYGDVRRDLTFVDDIVDTIVRMVDRDAPAGSDDQKHQIYNVGNSSPRPVQDVIAILETLLGRQAHVDLAPLPPGDMVETFANVEKLKRDFGYEPKLSLEDGLEQFVDWLGKWRAGAFA